MKSVVIGGLVGVGVGLVLDAYGVPDPSFVQLVIGGLFIGLAVGLYRNGWGK